MSEMSLAAPDFRNQCWLKKHHIFNLIKDKDLSMSWVKMKGHSGIHGNVKADLTAGAASGFPFSLCADVREHFLVAESVTVSGNVRHFVRNIFQSICCAHWKAESGCDVVPDAMIGCIDWVITVKVWHPDSYMLAGFTSCASSMLRTYVMKAVHRRLLVVVRKRLYDRCYPSVLCLFCGEVEFSDHAFTCVHEFDIHGEILEEASAYWLALAGGSPVSAMLARHWVVMEKAGLICDVGAVSGLPCGVSSVLSDGVVRLLGMANSFAVSFGRRKPYCFFSGLGGSVWVIIDV
ncbi:hypothetical protein G9A89_021332 [Geosiphon pyriformis]|nr:hypothetical protein G9A89_021332 [Geosiphon pyriformis]